MFYKNKTKIKFDDKLKNFIYNIRMKYPDLLTSLNYDVLLVEQAMLRKILIENQNEINIVNGKITSKVTNMPDYYAFLCAYVSDLDDCIEWEDINQNMIKRHTSCCEKLMNYSFPTLDEDIDDNYKVKCCCGHDCLIYNVVILKNPITQLNIIVGNVCLTKSGIVDKVKTIEDLRPSSLKQLHNKKKQKKELEKKRIQELKKYRPCIDCKKNNISIDKSAYFVRCYPCWKQMRILL